jgi:cell wall-associated NlpC family hydrolase
MLALRCINILKSYSVRLRHCVYSGMVLTVSVALAVLVLGVCSEASAESSSKNSASEITSAHSPLFHSLIAQRLVETAKELEGIPYRYGGSSQDTGLDCSGLLGLTFAKALGIKLPRRAIDMSKLGMPAPEDKLQGGDLVFFNTLGRNFSHVGLYLGDGKFIHAASRGAQRKVRINNLSDRYYRQRFNGARRISLALSRVPSRTGTWLWRLPDTSHS